MIVFVPISEISNVSRQLADTLGSTRRLYAVDKEPVPVTDGPGVILITRGVPVLAEASVLLVGIHQLSWGTPLLVLFFFISLCVSFRQTALHTLQSELITERHRSCRKRLKCAMLGTHLG